MSHQHGNGGMMPSMDNNATNMNMDTAMHMSFYWGINATILFPDWPNHNLPMYILSLFFIFSLSFGIEAFSVLTTANLPGWTGSGPVMGGLKLAAAYALRTALAYMVMMSVMSFNVGIFITAAIGHTVRFFVVGIFIAASAADITLKV
ncbi:copper transporter 6-like [Rhododendron vialii]|uniref:copper transporter 6-like n=1 Tax=Rhododendron vialii TaxID=182163 RepID=UPI00265F5522|nr:copper transporter 6-like [Rhododendron vialii]